MDTGVRGRREKGVSSGARALPPQRVLSAVLGEFALALSPCFPSIITRPDGSSRLSTKDTAANETD